MSQSEAVKILVAKTHFSQNAAEQFVLGLTEDDWDVIVALGGLSSAKSHLNSFLDLLAARRADSDVASALTEFTAGLKASRSDLSLTRRQDAPEDPPPLKPRGKPSPPVKAAAALPAAEHEEHPVSRETTRKKK